MDLAATIVGVWLGVAGLDVQLSDMDRFPCHKDNLAWADQHVAYLEQEMLWDRVHPEFWAAWREETAYARQPWRELMLSRQKTYEFDRPIWSSDAAGERRIIDVETILGYRSDDWRLRRLRDLRDLIGRDAYRNGVMPSIVNPRSLWRFRRLD